jgi:hypothetical protein
LLMGFQRRFERSGEWKKSRRLPSRVIPLRALDQIEDVW